MIENPKISIIIPYLKESKCIKLCVDKLEENSYHPYELVLIKDSKDVYGAFNYGAQRSSGNILVFLNDDMVVAKDWDKLIPKYLEPKMLLTNYLVESGWTGVDKKNIEHCFGMEVEDFDYDGFQALVDARNDPEISDTAGWYMPYAIQRDSFILYPNKKPFPFPNDHLLFLAFQSLGYKMKKVRSYTYHFQRMSHRTKECLDASALKVSQ